MAAIEIPKFTERGRVARAWPLRRHLEFRCSAGVFRKLKTESFVRSTLSVTFVGFAARLSRKAGVLEGLGTGLC